MFGEGRGQKLQLTQTTKKRLQISLRSMKKLKTTTNQLKNTTNQL